MDDHLSRSLSKKKIISLLNDVFGDFDASVHNASKCIDWQRKSFAHVFAQSSVFICIHAEFGPHGFLHTVARIQTRSDLDATMKMFQISQSALQKKWLTQLCKKLSDHQSKGVSKLCSEQLKLLPLHMSVSPPTVSVQGESKRSSL